MTTTPVRPMGRLRRPTLLAHTAALALALAAPGFAQTGTTARSDRNRPSEAELRDPEQLRKDVADLGESPIAAVLQNLGREVQIYNQHVTTLSSPFFEGRAPGTAGNEAAADYLEFYLRRAGLDPIFPSSVDSGGQAVETPRSSYRQPMRAGRHTTVNQEALVVQPGKGEPVALRPGKDFNILGTSGSGSLQSAPIAFVGYSITDGPDGYNNYAREIALTGKIALMFRFEPMNDEGRSRWVDRGWSPAAGLDNKLANARDAGASAILLVNPPGADDPRANEMMDSKSSIGSTRRFDIPIAMITPEAADRLVRASQGSPSLLELRQVADQEGILKILQGVSATLEADVERGPVMSDNVAGILAGKGDLADEYIVIGAHYDHVGYGPIGVINAENMGKLHPGADDNASGTAGVLMLAERLVNAYEQLPEDANARSIIFMGFTAEEGGLNGSRYFVNNPPMPLESIDFMVNMDMIGRLRDNKLDVDGVESAEGFYQWLKPFFDESGLVIKHGFSIPPNSDHYSFYAKKIPILSLFTGFHREYHTPADEAHLINAPGAVKALDMVEKIVFAAAQRPEKLKFAPPRRHEQDDDEGDDEETEQAAAAPPAPAANPHAPADAASPGPTPGRVRFGIAPGDYSDDTPGILVGEVYENTSAADAGIKVGDRMISWNGKKLTDVPSWMPLLSGAKPGDVVDIVVIRDGKELPIKVTLKARTPVAPN